MQVLLFEMDLPMELWYQNSRELTTPDVSEALRELEPLIVSLEAGRIGRRKDVNARLKGYLNNLKLELDAYDKENRARQAAKRA
jgi:hypothetical protein